MEGREMSAVRLGVKRMVVDGRRVGCLRVVRQVACRFGWWSLVVILKPDERGPMLSKLTDTILADGWASVPASSLCW